MARKAKYCRLTLYEPSTPAYFSMATKVKRHPGGRPPKFNKAEFGQITCVLRHDTIAMLRQGAASKHFGEYLQAHLDRYPPPSREEYLALTKGTPFYTTVKRKRIPVLIAAGSLSKEAKRLQRERARREKLSPEERAREDEFTARLKAVVTETYANNHP